ncbi:MAG: ABC transporter permease [Microbacterium sp.]
MREIITRHPLALFIARRLLFAVLLLVGVTVVTFTLTNLVPADPVQLALGDDAANDEEIVAQYRAAHGLDQPVVVQYFTYMGNLLRGDLGISTKGGAPIVDELGAAIPATLELAGVAVILSVLLGVAFGTVAAYRRGRFADQVLRVLSLAGISVPLFWLALVAYYFLFYEWNLLPGSGRLDPTMIPPPTVTGMYLVDSLIAGDMTVFGNALAHLLLPALVLTLYSMGLMVRFTRTSVLEVLGQDYVRAAIAKGLRPTRVVVGYVLRGAAVPIITVVGLIFGGLLSGTVLVEQVFAWNGLGQYAFNAARNLNVPAIMGVGLVVGVIYIMINLLVDLLYGFIDPRVRQ